MIRSTAAALLTAVAFASGASPALASRQENKDIVQTAVSAGNFTTLAKLLKTAGLVNALEKPGPFTVFAPTDAAFAKVPKGKLQALLKNKKKLRAVLLYHVVSGKLTAAQVAERKSARTLNGKTVRFRIRGGNAYVNNARVTTADVGASNGIIHVINRVLLP